MARTTMAIVASIPGRLGKRLNELRCRLDPDGESSLTPHVPLVGPFEVEPSFLPLERHCWEICHKRAPFTVALGELVLDESERMAYLPLEEGAERVVALREALLTGKYAPPRDDAPYEPRTVVGPPAYHDDLALTKWEETATMLQLSFLLERIELMAQYPDGAWYERDFYTLDRAVTEA